MKRILALFTFVASSVALTACDPTPGCYERTFRNGQTIIECR